MEGETRRGLSTARAVLQVQQLLAAAPDGVRADAVASALGKSVSTAYNLLTSLCEEGVAVHRAGGAYALAPAFRRAVAGTPGGDPRALVGDLMLRTRHRAYFAAPAGGGLHVVVERGVQGMPRLTGLSPGLIDMLHATALGKAFLAHAPAELVDRYVANGLRRFTPATITAPDRLRDELRRTRARLVAAEVEELREDFCCMAAPIFDRRRRLVGVAGISLTRRAFDDERAALEETVRDVARFQATDRVPVPAGTPL